MRLSIYLFLIIFLVSCDLNNERDVTTPNGPFEGETRINFIRGADLSYVNEMLDCGAVYYDSQGQATDPYRLFGQARAKLARFRLWHHPQWTDYSNYPDVKKAISRAREEGMDILLDFHYSDTWADPGQQEVPAAWLPVVNDAPALGDSLYNYTFRILNDLEASGLLPQYVQVGNEINAEILQAPNQSYTLHWPRNAFLINRAIQAVRDLAAQKNADIEIMLHIAQPENALWWFKEASANGLQDYDWIGLSYYPAWSDYNLNNLSAAISTLTQTYQKKLMVVETAYPFTLNNADGANNILGTDALLPDFPATEEGQYLFLLALEEAIVGGGGSGLVYWEPAWVSTSCRTQWGQGSHWDNATLFDHNRLALKGLSYFSHN